MAQQPLVIQTEDLDPEPAAWMASQCEFVVCPFDEEPRFGQLLARAEGLVVRTYTQVNQALLAKAPKLRVVGRAGVALENIDIPACRKRGVEVVHAPNANTRAVVEFVSAIIADATRPRLRMEQAVPAAQWHQIRREYVGERELNEMTLGIWGFGRIGSAIARYAAAMNMKAIYHELLDIPEARRSGAEPVSVDRLLAESDILTMHVDYRPQNKHLLNAKSLAKVKPRVLILNTSRGFVVDPAALAAFLHGHPEASARIDVHDPFEPITPDYPLLGEPNAWVTPHLASGTATAKRNMSWVVRDVLRVLKGEKPQHPAPTLSPA